MDSFDKRKAYGNTGEGIVKTYLEDTGHIVYTTDTLAPHPVDMICYSSSNQSVFYVEVKTKTTMNKYPAYTIDDTHLSGYKDMENTDMTMMLYCVNKDEKKIVGGKLSNLLRDSYKIKESDTYTCLPAVNFKLIKSLTTEEVKSIK